MSAAHGLSDLSIGASRWDPVFVLNLKMRKLRAQLPICGPWKGSCAVKGFQYWEDAPTSPLQ